jgi:hypothetical protein
MKSHPVPWTFAREDLPSGSRGRPFPQGLIAPGKVLNEKVTDRLRKRGWIWHVVHPRTDKNVHPKRGERDPCSRL